MVLREDINNFKNEVKADIENFKKEMRSEFAEIHAEIGQLNTKIEVQTARIDTLFHWNYWLLSIILVLVAMPNIIAGVKSLFCALSEGIAKIVVLFKRKGQIR